MQTNTILSCKAIIILCIHSTVLNFLLILSVLGISSTGLAGINFKPSTFFKSGTDYTYKAGTRGFSGGVVHFEQKDEVLHFNVTIKFLGAGTFSRTNLKEVLATSFPAIPPTEQFFTPNLDSFADNPLLAAKVTELARQIETKYQTQYTRLHLTIEFGHDSDYLTSAELKETDYRTYLSNLRNGVNSLHKQKSTEAIPVSVVGLPEAARASPSEWDIYSDPRLYSHELFHIIGSMFEGYERADYPPDGIMQDMYMINAVDQFGEGCQAGVLHLADVLELLSNSFYSAKPFTPKPENLDQLNALIRQDSSGHPTIDNSRQDYLTWPPQKMADSAKQAVLRWTSEGSRLCNQVLK